MENEILKIIPSSGNVFEDLEFKDAKQDLAKVKLLSRIQDILDEKDICPGPREQVAGRLLKDKIKL